MGLSGLGLAAEGWRGRAAPWQMSSDLCCQLCQHNSCCMFISPLASVQVQPGLPGLTCSGFTPAPDVGLTTGGCTREPTPRGWVRMEAAPPRAVGLEMNVGVSCHSLRFWDLVPGIWGGGLR